MTDTRKWEYSKDSSKQITELQSKTISTVAGEWVKFFFEIPEEDHPHSYYTLDYDKRRKIDSIQESFHSKEEEKNVGVWHLVGGYIDGFYKSYLPLTRTWAIMFSPYVAFSSKAEFPSLSTAQLKELVKKDVAGVYELVAKINGIKLKPIRISSSVEVDIKGANVLGIEATANVEVFFDGYFVLLKPLPPGDHLIESIGLAPNYENNVRYAVYSRGQK